MISEVERVVGSDYLAGLADRPTEHLRAMRAECANIENGISYVRRVAQGRLDILGAESARRDEGRGGDAHDLVDRLPQLLSDHARGVAAGRLTEDLDPPEEIVVPLTAHVDEVVAPGVIASVAELDATALSAARGALQKLEHELSELRNRVHLTIDALNDELAERYRTGEAPGGS